MCATERLVVLAYLLDIGAELQRDKVVPPRVAERVLIRKWTRLPRMCHEMFNGARLVRAPVVELKRGAPVTRGDRRDDASSRRSVKA